MQVCFKTSSTKILVFFIPLWYPSLSTSFPVAVIVTISEVVGLVVDETETVTDGSCVSMLNVPSDDPCEHESKDVWPLTEISVSPFISASETMYV